jgi:Holliday junction DNA helicase RuvA
MQERDLFDSLLGVTGIGPKLALSLIGHLPVHDLHLAISIGDIPTITKVPGIGKKTAERLIIEMRDKLPDLMPTDLSDLAVQMPSDPNARKISDAMSALINLGYNQITAQKAIKKTLSEKNDTIQLAELITYALKNV